MSEAENTRLHAIINGRVQGVGFRYFVHDNALSMGLYGWVRNRLDGSVELLAEGERKVLEKMLVAVRRGPRASMVLGIETKWKPATGEYKDFRILPTTM